MKKLKYFLIFAFAFVISNGTPSLASAKTHVYEDIASAKAMLQNVKLNYVGEGSAAQMSVKSRDSVLAIYNPATDKINLVTGSLANEKFSFNNPEYSISAARFNGVNTWFNVTKPAGGVVLAQKYLVMPIESGTKSAIEASMYEVVYVPYSSQLNTPEISSIGRSYLDDVVKKAAAELSSKPSTQNSAKTVPEMVPSHLVKAIVYAEQTDTASLIGADPLSAMSRAETLFAGNLEQTFRFSISSAGARGISQFMPGTYASLVERHKSVSLIKDFNQAMTNHINAMKASYLLLDDYIADVQRRSGDQFSQADRYEAGAAGYNGGTSRAARSIVAFGTSWWENRTSQINSIKAEVAAKQAKLASLQARLSTASESEKQNIAIDIGVANQELNSLTQVLANLEDNSLRNETANYVLKVRSAMSVLKNQKIDPLPNVPKPTVVSQPVPTVEGDSIPKPSASPTFPATGKLPSGVKQGSLVKGSAPTVFLISDGQKKPMSGDLFKIWGFSFKNISVVSDKDLDSIPLGPMPVPKPMTFFSDAKTKEFWVYLADGKHLISPFVAKQKKMSPDYVFSPEYIASMPVSTPIIPKDATIIKGDASTAVFLIQNRVASPLTYQAFVNRKISPKQITILPQVEVNGYVKGAVIDK